LLPICFRTFYDVLSFKDIIHNEYLDPVIPNTLNLSSLSWGQDAVRAFELNQKTQTVAKEDPVRNPDDSGTVVFANKESLVLSIGANLLLNYFLAIFLSHY